MPATFWQGSKGPNAVPRALETAELPRQMSDYRCGLRMPNVFQDVGLFSFTSSTAQGGGGSFKKRKTIGEIGCCESRMSKQKH